MIVLDANVLIGHLDERDAHHERAAQVLLDSADRPVGASSITLAEVLVGPTRAGRLAGARAALRTLGVAEIPLAGDAAERLALLRVETGLRMPDCCVLLAAEDVRGTVHTFDERLARQASLLGLCDDRN